MKKLRIDFVESIEEIGSEIFLITEFEISTSELRREIAEKKYSSFIIPLASVIIK